MSSYTRKILSEQHRAVSDPDILFVQIQELLSLIDDKLVNQKKFDEHLDSIRRNPYVRMTFKEQEAIIGLVRLAKEKVRKASEAFDFFSVSMAEILVDHGITPQHECDSGYCKSPLTKNEDTSANV